RIAVNTLNSNIELEGDDICSNASARALVTIQNGDGPFNYLWSNGSTDALNQIDEAGQYFLTITDQNNCAFVDSITVELNGTPIEAELSIAGELNCTNDNDRFAIASVVSGTAPFTYTWSNGSTDELTVLDEPGWYVISITDAGSCTYTDSIEYLAYTGPVYLAEASQPNCRPNSRGSININSIEGAGPFEYALNDGNYLSVNALPLTIRALQPGDYELHLRDANGCISTQDVTIAPPPEIEVNFPVQIRIKKGEQAPIRIVSNIEPETIRWTPTDGLSCTDCLVPVAAPDSTIRYLVTLSYPGGCDRSAFVDVYVNPQRRVFVPNAFSPNGDDENDFFVVEAGPEVVLIKSLQIVDRWGNLAYEASDFQPGDISFGWDGRYDGQWALPGVYVYRLELQFDDGEVMVTFGDLTVVR
ncbi:MAG: gliding motility-associated C-terminal domain-containing protein, partial [Bacteroidota bacterium]